MISTTTPLLLLTTCLAASSTSSAFQIPSSPLPSSVGRVSSSSSLDATSAPGSRDFGVASETASAAAVTTRRSAVAAALSSLVLLPSMASLADDGGESMYTPKFVQSYEDFTSTSEGWSYKEVKVGQEIGGGDLKDGDRVVFDWSGYTIGYFGRPFEAKGGPQGGAFDKDLNYFRTTLGSKTVVPGLECALRGMRPGGIRQVIVPYGPLSYPPEDKEHELVGPKPTTFSGMRALNFVLENPRVDRTLLFNIKLIRVDRSDGKGGFIRG